MPASICGFVPATMHPTGEWATESGTGAVAGGACGSAGANGDAASRITSVGATSRIVPIE